MALTPIGFKIRTSSMLNAGMKPEVSVVLPCLNEAETLATCIAQIWETFQKAHLRGEIIVADNGSTDGSP